MSAIRTGPAAGPGAGQKLDPAKSSSSLETLAPLDEIARHVDGSFVLVVMVTAGRYRRRCFLTIKAAENAARRATDRGENAKVYLCQLQPLWVVRGGDSG